MVGLAIPLYQTIDTFTINKLLIQIGYMQGEAEKINAIIGLVQMVVLIPVSVATAFSMSLVPEMTKAHNRKYEAIVQTFYENKCISSSNYGTGGNWNDGVSQTCIYSFIRCWK